MLLPTVGLYSNCILYASFGSQSTFELERYIVLAVNFYVVYQHFHHGLVRYVWTIVKHGNWFKSPYLQHFYHYCLSFSW